MRISVVVPSRNSVRTIRACLDSVRQQTHSDVELVVVDNHSSDGTDRVARELADLVLVRGPERSAQRNAGAAAATGEVVLFVDSDMVLEPGVCAAVAAELTARPDLSAIVVPERSFGEGYLSRCRALEKSLYVGVDQVEAARAFRREALELVGGWNEDLTAAEDWDLEDRMRAAGVRVGRVSAAGSWIWHDEGRTVLRACFAKKRYYGRWIGRYVEERGSTATRRMARGQVLRRAPLLLADPAHAAGMVALKAVEVAGIAAGVRDARSGRVAA